MSLFGNNDSKSKKKKKDEPKINVSAIENSFDATKEKVQEMLDNYDMQIENYTNKVVTCLKQKRQSEANRYKEKLKQIMFRRERMSQLYDQIDSFQMMINEALAKNEVYKTLGNTLAQVNTIKMNPQMASIIKEMKKFEKDFADSVSSFDRIFDNVGGSINKIDLDTSNEFDSEIKAIVDDKLQQMEDTTFNVEEKDDAIDDLLGSL